jgi:hypothetical protein
LIVAGDGVGGLLRGFAQWAGTALFKSWWSLVMERSGKCVGKKFALDWTRECLW